MPTSSCSVAQTLNKTLKFVVFFWQKGEKFKLFLQSTVWADENPVSNFGTLSKETD